MGIELGSATRMRLPIVAASVAIVFTSIFAPPVKGAECQDVFVRANSIFIRATVECKRDYMDTSAGYYALAMTRQCARSIFSTVDAGNRWNDPDVQILATRDIYTLVHAGHRGSYAERRAGCFAVYGEGRSRRFELR